MTFKIHRKIVNFKGENVTIETSLQDVFDDLPSFEKKIVHLIDLVEALMQKSMNKDEAESALEDLLDDASSLEHFFRVSS
jgi:hypothetical protein